MKKSDVLKHFGSQAAVADALTLAGHQCSQPAVCKWSEDIPPLRAYQIDEITGGDLSDKKLEPPKAA